MSIELARKVKEGRAIYVLVPLLLLHLTLLSLQVEDPSGTLLIKRWMLGLEAPFLNFFSTAAAGARKVWYGYFWLHGVREENLRLQSDVQRLSLQANRMAELEQENVRLRKLVVLAENSGFEMIAARVVSRTPNYLSSVIYINRGAEDGIRADCAVLSGSGIVGRIVLVTRHNAEVQLIANADASVGVLIASTRSPGVLRGTGESLLDLDYISNTDQVNVGDTIVTSGLDGIYPKGLPVGRVVDSQTGKSIFRAIKVQPLADLVHMEEVSVILKKNP